MTFQKQVISRRGFLIGATAVTGGFAVGFSPVAMAEDAPAAAAPINPLTAYVTITADNRISIASSQFDMGQGSYYGIGTLVLEELGGSWDQTTVVGGAGNSKIFGNLAFGGQFQMTGGSSSMASSWDRYRIAGAAAREMLVAAAAARWGVPAGEITVSGGTVAHGAKTATFGELAEAAAGMPVPAEPALKGKADWTLIGNADVRRFDGPSKTNGTHQFTIDVKLPGMLTATMIHPPKFGATVKSFDATAAKALPGVVDVVETPRGIAVVGQHMWAAITGRDAVTVEWDESKAESRGSAEIMATYRELAAKEPAHMALGDAVAADKAREGATLVEAVYEFPYLAHAALEPLNAVAWMNPEGVVEIWGGHQAPDFYQMVAAQVAGVTPDKVKLHVMKTGGSFGRRAVLDADIIVEAVATARATGWKAPVRVQWTRDNDMKGGRYRPAYVHALKAGVTADGRIVGWEHHIVGQSIMTGGPFESMVKDGVDPTSVEGAHQLPYAIADRAVGLTTTDVGVPVLWWRAVGSTHTAFAIETFLDELAKAAGKDPLDFRLALLEKSPRHAAVLKLAAEKGGWGTPLPEGRFRGLAMAESFQTPVAQVVEISMADGGVKVHKVVCAVDCGVPINPDNIKAQMEGGIGFGLGAILAEELTLTGGVVDQANYDGYTPLRMDAMPSVEVHIVDSPERPTGVGEPGVPPIGPAVANAIFAGTGQKVRVLPMSKGLQA